MSAADEREAGFRRTPTADKMGWPGRVAITLNVDVNGLSGYTDSYLAALWHTTQAAPAPYGDKLAVEVVRQLTSEIVRRWLGKAPAEMYHHQANAHESAVHMAIARYRPGGADDYDGAFHDGATTVKGAIIDTLLAGPPAGTTCPYCGNDGTEPARPGSYDARTNAVLDRGATGLAPILHGPGAGQVWICRDSDACKSRVYKAAEADTRLLCARCNRHPGIAAAQTELVPATAEAAGLDPALVDGPVCVCADRARCERRIARGARPPYRWDADQQASVAEIGVRNALSQGLGPAKCGTCGHNVPAELKSPHKVTDPALARSIGPIAGAWRCRDTDACDRRVAEKETPKNREVVAPDKVLASKEADPVKDGDHR